MTGRTDDDRSREPDNVDERYDAEQRERLEAESEGEGLAAEAGAGEEKGLSEG
ncbi:MAG TPA: hypothetical protein VD859_03305 [Nocardioides sp.]|nr:hypothetical protein [Nocardioides sp.]